TVSGNDGRKFSGPSSATRYSALTKTNNKRKLIHAYSRGRRRRDRRLFRRQAAAGRQRRDVPGEAEARFRTRKRRPRHQESRRRRDAQEPADGTGRQARRKIRRRAAELQGVRP